MKGKRTNLFLVPSAVQTFITNVTKTVQGYFCLAFGQQDGIQSDVIDIVAFAEVIDHIASTEKVYC